MTELFNSIVVRLQEVFNPQNMGEKIVEGSINLIVALVTFGAFYLIWLIARSLVNAVMERSELDETSQAFTRTILQYSILLTGLFNALSAMNIDTAGLLASLGIVGITIGFAARDAFSNLISGVLIYLDRPFVIGDLVEIGDYYGEVNQITLRSTRVVTSDGKMLAVPNTEMINKTVTSYTNFPHLRLDIQATIGVGESIDKVRNILLGIVENDPEFMSEPPARVIVTQLNDYNVAVELQVWIDDERSHVAIRAELREKVFNALTEAKVDMPFETISLNPLQVDVLDRQS
jgi:small conductance mechanosensitive channel